MSKKKTPRASSKIQKADRYAVFLSQALTAHQQGKLAEAARGYEYILAKEAQHFDALHYLGLVKMQTGFATEGILLIEQALQIQPNDTHALGNLGSLLFTAKRPSEALTYLDHTLRLDPQQAQAHTNRGLSLAALGRYEEAALAHEQALKIQPDFVEALTNYGNALRALLRTDEAIRAYDTALSVRPRYPEALNNRGLALATLRRFDEALASYESALTLRPNYPEALNNRGNVYNSQRKFDTALASYAQALTLNPRYAEAHYNRGNVYGALNQHEQALLNYQAAIDLQPDHVDAHWNTAFAHLLLGNMQLGWAQYEWRWQLKNADKPREFDCPRWTGAENLAGKHIILWAEQGLGDTLQFCRYANALTEKGAVVTLEVQAPLTRLLTSAPGVSAVIARGTPPPFADFHCPMLSVPLALNEAAIASHTRYLSVPADALEKWRNQIDARAGAGSAKRLRIGITCSGNPKLANDHNRSIPLAQFAPLLDMDVALFFIQKDCRSEDEAYLQAHPQIHDLRNELDDFVDTAAVISQLDLVISVDTSVAHLTGALGCPLWVLLPFAPDWRWQLGRTDNPWYPSARLWRQCSIGDWEGVILQLVQALWEKTKYTQP